MYDNFNFYTIIRVKKFKIANDVDTIIYRASNQNFIFFINNFFLIIFINNFSQVCIFRWNAKILD